MMALAGMEFETLVFELDALTTRPPPTTFSFFRFLITITNRKYCKTNRSMLITKKSRIQ